jgi:phosphopantetheine adenylyltransferase
MCTIINRSQNNDNFDRTVTRRQKASRSQSIIKLDNTITERPQTSRSQSIVKLDNTITETPKTSRSQSIVISKYRQRKKRKVSNERTTLGPDRHKSHREQINPLSTSDAYMRQ